MDHVTETMLRLARERYAESIRNKADRLRELAVELDQIADRALTVDTPDFHGAEMANSLAYLGGQVVHEVIGVLPNLNLARLADEALDYERAKATDDHS